MIHRRSLLLGLASAFAAPAIVRADALMKVRPWGGGFDAWVTYIKPPFPSMTYGRSPGMSALQDCIDIQAAMRRYAELFDVEHMLIGAR